MLFSTLLKLLSTAPNTTAAKNPVSHVGSTSRTSRPYTSSTSVMPPAAGSVPYRCNAVSPGSTITSGASSLNAAAASTPFCPVARLSAANVRWMICWFVHQ